MVWAQKSRRKQELPPNWQYLRKQTFIRDNYKCVLCGAPATDCDHIGNKHNHEITNLRSLCTQCHRKRTGKQGGSAKRHTRLRKNNPEQHPSKQWAQKHQ